MCGCVGGECGLRAGRESLRARKEGSGTGFHPFVGSLSRFFLFDGYIGGFSLGDNMTAGFPLGHLVCLCDPLQEPQSVRIGSHQDLVLVCNGPAIQGGDWIVVLSSSAFVFLAWSKVSCVRK